MNDKQKMKEINCKHKVVFLLLAFQLLSFMGNIGCVEMQASTKCTAKESILYDRKLDDRKANT